MSSIRYTVNSCLVGALMLSFVKPPAEAQGTISDYERANTLSQRVTGKVVKANWKPDWFGNKGRFWYRLDLGEGRREYALVDPAIPSKHPAFDHTRMADSLTGILGRKVDPARLPVDTISYSAGLDTVHIQVGDKTFACDLKTYTLHPETKPLGHATALSLEDAPRTSRSGGEETVLNFVNRTNGNVLLYWMDTEGQRKEYGTLKPGEQRDMHTYAGHVWLATTLDNKPLGVFVAQALPDSAVIDGAVLAPRPRPRRANRADAAISPNGKWRVFVRDNNVMLQAIKQGTTEGDTTPLTTDGKPEDRYEGQPIWSPDSTKCVVFKTVPAEEHKIYLVESSPKDQVQPKLHPLDYLKPGDRVAHQRPHLFNIATKRDIPIKDDLFSNPFELDDIQWDPDSTRFTSKYNQRGHQVMRLIGVDATSGEAKTLIEEQAKTFIDWTNKVFLHRVSHADSGNINNNKVEGAAQQDLQTGRHRSSEAIWMSERDGWNHLYLYDTQTGLVKNQITRGPWVVRKVDRVDDIKRQIWFQASGIHSQQDPYYIHYCRIDFDGSNLTMLTEGDGTHTLTYSPDGNYYVDSYSRVDMPPVTELHLASTGKKILDLEKGDASTLLATGWKYPERFVAKGRDDKTDIYGVIVRPINFDPKRRYPVIEDIYAGPQGSFVPKAFSPANGLQALAELGFIVVQIDGMGTNNRSKAFHDVCWKNLGDAGFLDRIKWIRAAAVKYPFMDLSRVGIYGTSAGGQNALGGLLQYGDFYKVGVADCGCHDNRMDKIWWNEQWMGWPLGPEYAAQSNVTLAPKLQGKLLLMVGEMDTNVDPASTMQVVNALIKADKDFDLLIMPGQGHGVVGSPYGKRRLQDFFVHNLLGVEPRRPAQIGLN